MENSCVEQCGSANASRQTLAKIDRMCLFYQTKNHSCHSGPAACRASHCAAISAPRANTARSLAAVAQHQPLALARRKAPVLPDDVAAAHRRRSRSAPAARARGAVARETACSRAAAARLGRRLRPAPARCPRAHRACAVMRFDDLDVVIRRQRARRACAPAPAAARPRGWCWARPAARCRGGRRPAAPCSSRGQAGGAEQQRLARGAAGGEVGRAPPARWRSRWRRRASRSSGGSAALIVTPLGGAPSSRRSIAPSAALCSARPPRR